MESVNKQIVEIQKQNSFTLVEREESKAGAKALTEKTEVRKAVKTTYSIAALLLLQKYINDIKIERHNSSDKHYALIGFLIFSLESAINVLKNNVDYFSIIDPKLLVNKKDDVFDYDQFTTNEVIKTYHTLTTNKLIDCEKTFDLEPFSIEDVSVSLLDKNSRKEGIPLILGLATQCCLTIDRTGYNYVLAQMFDPNVNALVIKRQDGVMLACIQIWVNEDGHLVLDTIDVAKMKNEKEKIAPELLLKIVKEVSNKLLDENPSVKSVTLGIGGNTIKNILTKDQFKELTKAHPTLTRDNVVQFFSKSFHSYPQKNELMNSISSLTGLHLTLTTEDKIITMKDDPFYVTGDTGYHRYDSFAQTKIAERSSSEQTELNSSFKQFNQYSYKAPSVTDSSLLDTLESDNVSNVSNGLSFGNEERKRPKSADQFKGDISR